MDDAGNIDADEMTHHITPAVTMAANTQWNADIEFDRLNTIKKKRKKNEISIVNANLHDAIE